MGPRCQTATLFFSVFFILMGMIIISQGGITSTDGSVNNAPEFQNMGSRPDVNASMVNSWGTVFIVGGALGTIGNCIFPKKDDGNTFRRQVTKALSFLAI